MSLHVIEAKFLLLDVRTTTLSPSIWHMKSVHITEAKVLLRKIYYYIESQYLHGWGKVFTAGGMYYFIESPYLSHKVSTHPWGQVSTARGQYYYIEFKYLTH